MNSAASSELPPITSPYVVIDDFVRPDIARTFRADIDGHFRDSSTFGTLDVWSYFRLSDGHVCLRTAPESVIAASKINTFIGVLRDWSIRTLGFGAVTSPTLSLYDGGTGPAFHGELRNGRFGYVYFLTGPNRQAGEGDIVVKALDTIEARFNRLFVFDGRLVHDMEYVGRLLDPFEGCVALHGHIEEGGPIVTGALPFSALHPAIVQAMDQFLLCHDEEASKYHGPATVRFTIGTDGTVRGLRLMLDRVVGQDDGDSDGLDRLKANFLWAFQDVRYPCAAGETTVVFPVALASEEVP